MKLPFILATHTVNVGQKRLKISNLAPKASGVETLVKPAAGRGEAEESEFLLLVGRGTYRSKTHSKTQWGICTRSVGISWDRSCREDTNCSFLLNLELRWRRSTGGGGGAPEDADNNDDADEGDRPDEGLDDGDQSFDVPVGMNDKEAFQVLS